MLEEVRLQRQGPPLLCKFSRNIVAARQNGQGFFDFPPPMKIEEIFIR